HGQHDLRRFRPRHGDPHPHREDHPSYPPSLHLRALLRPTVLAGGGSLLVSWLLQLEEPLGRLLVPGQASVALGSGALLLAAASLALATDLPGRSGRGHDAPRASAPDSP